MIHNSGASAPREDLCLSTKSRADMRPQFRLQENLHHWASAVADDAAHHFAESCPPWAQTVVATPVRFLFTGDSNSSSASAGVFQPSVFLGRPLRAAATADISSAL